MKSLKIFPLILCALPIAANAAIPYRAEQVGTPAVVADGALNDPEAFARTRRFYIGGAYNFSIWNDGADDNVRISGKNTSSFEGMLGVRVYDTFRMEANYARTAAEWDSFKLTGNTVFVNAIFDARFDSIYRMFRKQIMVPYVGLGGGISWNSVDDAQTDNKITPVAAVMAGLGLELGDRFTVDLGYRYIYMFTPKFDVIQDYAPTAHQFRAGVRVNF